MKTININEYPNIPGFLQERGISLYDVEIKILSQREIDEIIEEEYGKEYMSDGDIIHGFYDFKNKEICLNEEVDTEATLIHELIHVSQWKGKGYTKESSSEMMHNAASQKYEAMDREIDAELASIFYTFEYKGVMAAFEQAKDASEIYEREAILKGIDALSQRFTRDAKALSMLFE